MIPAVTVDHLRQPLLEVPIVSYFLVPTALLQTLLPAFLSFTAVTGCCLACTSSVQSCLLCNCTFCTLSSPCSLATGPALPSFLSLCLWLVAAFLCSPLLVDKLYQCPVLAHCGIFGDLFLSFLTFELLPIHLQTCRPTRRDLFGTLWGRFIHVPDFILDNFMKIW